jgi:DMSO/TMAO reductase YedYZ molybdopterin-dependent catalytic subunit
MAAEHPPEDAAWVHGHAHDPNPLPPAGDGSFVVRRPAGEEVDFSVETLAALPQCEVVGCLIVSTGHGTSGPFTFGGVRLADLLAYVLTEARAAAHTATHAAERAAWHWVDVISADGFGTRLFPAHLAETGEPPILLAVRRDGQPLTREQGLTRLIVPSERDDALRQVKWVARIEIA